MKKDWRIKKAKEGSKFKYEYKEVYLKEAYARYKKKYNEEIKKGNVFVKYTRKEFDNLMNKKLNNPSNPHYHGDKDSFATQIIKKSKSMKKKPFEKLKQLADQYKETYKLIYKEEIDINQNMSRFALHNRIAELVELGAFGDQTVDEFLY